MNITKEQNLIIEIDDLVTVLCQFCQSIDKNEDTTNCISQKIKELYRESFMK